MDRGAEHVLKGGLDQLGEAAVAVEEGTVRQQGGRSLPHLLDHDAVGAVGALQRVDLLSLLVEHHQGIHLSLADGAQRVFRLFQAGSELFDVVLRFSGVYEIGHVSE